MRKKDILAAILGVSPIASLFLWCRRLFKKELVVLAYHRVADYDLDNYQYDSALISATTDDFDYQLRYVKKHFNPISMAQLVASVHDGVPLPKKPLLITFDDGFNDNYTNAFPILKKHGLNATIFVSTEFIGTDKSIWFDKLAAIIINTKLVSLDVPEMDRKYMLGDFGCDRTEIQSDIFRDFKSLDNLKLQKILNRLFFEFSGEISNIQTQQSRMLTWQQIKKMSQSVVELGSHTVTHPILTKLTAEMLSFELRESKLVLEQKTGVTVDTISYPNGDRESFSNDVICETEKQGYKLGFTYIPAHNRLPIENRFKIDRIHVEHYVDRHHFKCLLFWPELFSGL